MGNLVGSLEVPTDLHARKNLCLSMTERQREILIGCILGDAYISKLGKIRIEQSVKQSEYVAWKYRELNSLCYGAFPREIVHKLKKNSKTYHSIFFNLRQYFKAWRLIFYSGRQKVFPENLVLTPLSMSVWYMDDGCWTGKKFVISTESFKGKSMDFLQNALRKQFGLETSSGKNGKLVIRKISHPRFIQLVSPHTISSMRYKLPNPVTTSSVRYRRELSVTR